MNIAFISHRLTPHQIPFCREMVQRCEGFAFIQMEDWGADWESKGEKVIAAEHPYVMHWTEEPQACQKIIDTYDAAIATPAYMKLLLPRMKKNKPVFVYLERFFKQGIHIKNFLRAAGGMYLHHMRYQKHKPYLLCASGYCAGDASRFGCYVNRSFRWGYFPRMEAYDLEKLMLQKDSCCIMWAGRLIGWKHPEMMLALADKLKRNNFDARIYLYGSGEKEEELKREIQARGLDKTVYMMGALPAEGIREAMKKSAIFVATSDHEEGWGVVVNEAMNSGCAVVASHAMGSVPFLIEDGKNGCIFKNGNENELYEKVAGLLSAPERCDAIGKNAYHSISGTWNAAEAATRLIKLAEAITHGADTELYTSGPCSQAPVVCQKNMYAYIRNGNGYDKDFTDNTPVSQ